MQQPLRILVVEDEPIVAMCLEMGLKQAGYQICQMVTSGEDAIRSAAQDAPDLILMDIRLAGDLDGIEAAQEIRATANIPLIFMTGYSEPTSAARAEQLQPLAYFIKPVSIRALQIVVNSAFPS